MRTSIRVTLIALFFVASTVALAQTQNDITIHVKGFAPSCSFSDAEIKFSNSSGTYLYRVEIDIDIENDAPGRTHCSGTCSTTRCEFNLSGSYDVPKNANVRHAVGGTLPPCNSCSPDCDTGNPGNCDPAHHCVCAYGTYLVKQYSTDGEEWHNMTSSLQYITATELELADECPTSNCEY